MHLAVLQHKISSNNVGTVLIITSNQSVTNAIIKCRLIRDLRSEATRLEHQDDTQTEHDHCSVMDS